MKLIHGIVGCALAAGLTAITLPAEAANASIIYTKLNLNLMVQYNDSKGTIHEATITSKDLLKLLGFPKKDELVTDYDGFGDPAGVFVLDKGVIVADLTSAGVLSIDFSKVVNKRQDEGKNGSFIQSEKGDISLSFDFSGSSTQAFVVPKGTSEAPPSVFSFDCSGVYTWEAIGSGVKKGEQKIATALTAHSFVGNGFDSNLAPTTPAIQSNAKTPGNGDFVIKDGTDSGKGSGTVPVD